MSILLSDTRTWKRSIDAISALISEGNFEFAEDGIRFSAVDPSQVAFVDFRMPRSSFDDYVANPVKAGLDLVELSKVVSRSLPTDRLAMTVASGDLIIKLDGALSRRFKLPLLDISDNQTPKPSVSFTASVEVNARLLKEALKDATLFGSSVVFRVTGDTLIIEAHGPQGNLKSILKARDNVKIQSSEEVVSKYSLGFLNNILREADTGDIVKLELKNEAPIRVSYRIGDADISYYLANIML